VPPICSILFPAQGCQLDFRETEILFFLLVIVAFRNRRAGSVTLVNYLSSAFPYVKTANIILYFYSDPRLGAIYVVLWLLQALTISEPCYEGPDKVLYFRGNFEDEVLRGDPRVTWLVAYYAAWSPACVQFAPVFAKLSNDYGCDFFRFGKLDVTRHPDTAKDQMVSDSAYSRQLPTVVLYKGGKEVKRRPFVDHKGVVVRFPFTQQNLANAFDLNNVYQESKKLVKDKTAEKKDA
jgi:thiol-disulfide isomerase/thioredoxin